MWVAAGSRGTAEGGSREALGTEEVANRTRACRIALETILGPLRIGSAAPYACHLSLRTDWEPERASWSLDKASQAPCFESDTHVPRDVKARKLVLFGALSRPIGESSLFRHGLS